MKIVHILMSLGLSLTPGAAPCPVRTVAAVDLEQYQGRWRQLAAIPSPFQQDCVRDTSATYRPAADGLLQVINRCYRADGSLLRIEGRARVVDAAAPGKLQVTFVRSNNQWVFVPGGDYWILGLGEGYEWAVVGDPTRRSGFVLSRTATLTPTQLARVLVVLLRNGYNPCDFAITATTGGVAVNRSVCSV